MTDNKPYEDIAVTSLAELDSLVSQRLNLPLLPYSSDWNAAMQIVDKLGLIVSRDYSKMGEDEGEWWAGKDGIWNHGRNGLIEVCKFALWLHWVDVNLF